MNESIARAILKTIDLDLDLDFTTGASKAGTRVNRRVQAVNARTHQRIDLMSYAMFRSISHKTFDAIVTREVVGAQ